MLCPECRKETNHEEKAMKIWKDRYNCAQAVLGAFAEELGLSEEQAMKVALCFSAGARKGEVCGAVSGATMALGLRYGKIGDNEAESKVLAYQKASEFMDRFKSENGTYICREILGCDLSTEEGRTYAQENNCFDEICPNMVKLAVKILESIV
ncbi:MAG: C-GCAxxG-C-C family protein [Lachnospiraceae bacterium]|nr:C-GCAxxG-C-C family protein [Lachnospiraceae bacterium]